MDKTTKTKRSAPSGRRNNNKLSTRERRELQPALTRLRKEVDKATLLHFGTKAPPGCSLDARLRVLKRWVNRYLQPNERILLLPAVDQGFSVLNVF